MTIPIYQIDAFTHQVFHGNPAAVCPLPTWLDDAALQAIAAENNLSETAFFVKKDNLFELRWFTPKTEVDLCGHATLATAFVIFSYLEPDRDRVQFQSQSGLLEVVKSGDLLVMDFPARPAVPGPTPPELIQALGPRPTEVLRARDYLVVYDHEQTIRSVQPNLDLLLRLDSLGVIITAPGTDADFVSRFFAPKVGVPEDPVTGSAHATLIPYWSKRLGKKKMQALQVSERGGELECEDLGERVKIGGAAVLYCQGTIHI